jgi:hypothetical protein
VAIAKHTNEVADRREPNGKSLRGALTFFVMPTVADHLQDMNRCDRECVTRKVVLDEIGASDQPLFLTIKGHKPYGCGTRNARSETSTLK